MPLNKKCFTCYLTRVRFQCFPGSLNIMKKKNILNIAILLISSFIIVKETSGEKQPEVLRYFSLLPLSAFDNSVDGLSLEERKNLIANSESANWKMVLNSEIEIVLKGIHAIDNIITIRIFSSPIESRLLAVQTQNAHVNLLEFWRFDKEGKAKKVDILPKLWPNDFISEKDHVYKHSSTVSYTLGQPDSVNVFLNRRMDPVLNKIRLKYNVHLHWNGKNFTTEKSIRSDYVITPVKLLELDGIDCSKSINRTVSGVTDKKRLSQSLNKKGMLAYQKKDFEKATWLFRCSFITDNSNPFAHYNYASILALYESQVKDPCNDEYISRIKKHVILSVQLRPERRSRLQKDADFDSIRDEPFYKLLIVDTQKDDLIQLLFSVGTWHGPVPGVYPTSKIAFEKDNRVLFYSFSLNEPIGWNEPEVGKLSGKNLNLIIQFTSSPTDPLIGTLKLTIEKGVITDAFIEIGSVKYNYYEDICSA